MTAIDDGGLRELVGRLTLEEKVALLTGRDFWSTVPVTSIGLRSIVFSDGPSGVRGPVWDERSPSVSLPSASALSASWDRMVAAEYGHASASEARRKGVDVVLGPTINLHRSPLAGRHFEAFSEDPLLTAELAAAYVDGVQRFGVAATPKHYIANDFETERFTASAEVDERTLREVYLRAFETAVVQAHAWAVMSSYNSVNGVTASEHELLETPLNSEWGFDGVVVSDWTGVRSIAAARASQDLAMPGPEGPWGDPLVEAVRAGEVDESAIDRKVVRILRLAARVGALGDAQALPVAPVDSIRFARDSEIAGTVLVANDGILPLDPAPARIAVIGYNARVARFQGGGSATVLPECVVSPLAGVRAAFPGSRVDYALGAVVQDGLTDIPLEETRNPRTGEQGVRLRLLGADGEVLVDEDRFASSWVWFGGDAPISRGRTLEVVTEWTPADSGEVEIGFTGVGRGRLVRDGQTLLDQVAQADGEDLGASLLSPSTCTVRTSVEAGRTYALEFRLDYEPADGALGGVLSAGFGLGPDLSDPDELLAEAEILAAESDVVVLVVGTNSRVESEGRDRADLDLPGRQDELARRVLAANPRTVVVVNSGSPVLLPWADAAAAVLLTWFGGQEYGHALGDILSGAAEPGGRLPTTWPREFEDLPVRNVTPHEGRLRYDEGIHVGYRAWLRSGRTPRFWFGEGRGYTTFETTTPTVRPEADEHLLTTTVTNTGARRGKHVVQVYASRPDSAIDRPVRWLAGFAPVWLDPGERAEVHIRIPKRTFAHWDRGWVYEPGEFALAIGASAGDVGESVRLVVGQDPS
ncbi:beta-glucosidase [Micromonospora pallida]|uniref:Beta-glucosidase n=1 Tax=Micromonospora pallida TaxID=145854 RepID=A0A1C6SIB6_9ACTN|nr:glycoside hydrolase family 3 C-terminal domain-containing protein [Micromonospora pallida]SCL29201.1 beta-glucosidase [Micromonospora pallida]